MYTVHHRQIAAQLMSMIATASVSASSDEAMATALRSPPSSSPSPTLAVAGMHWPSHSPEEERSESDERRLHRPCQVARPHSWL